MAEEAATAINNDWNLDAARRLLRAFTVSPTSFDRPNAATDAAADNFDVAAYDPSESEPTSLGDFDRLWRFRGVPTGSHPHRSRHGSTESSSSSISSAGSTAPSSAPEIASDGADGVGKGLDTDEATEGEDFSDFVNRNKAVRWKDEVSGLELSTTRRRSAAPSATDVDVEKLSKLIRMEDRAFGNLLFNSVMGQSRGEHSAGGSTTPTFHMTLRSAKKHGLIPAILPAAPPSLSLTPPSYLDTRLIQPRLALTATEKKALLVRKLREKKLLAQDFDASLAVARWGENVRSDGLHVFVDLSNINIGFFNELKKLRGIGKGNSPKMPPIAFHSLAFILERNRPVFRRVLAGSHGGLMHGHRARRPDHMYDAEKCGYELNILEPVFKVKSLAPVRKNRNGTGNGYATTSGHSSGSDGPTPGTQVRQEQCVDEILQMKMLESLVDVEEPSTLVLASGDGAEAEYSGGFLKMVERFLRKGWNVELFAWSDGLSMEYRSKSFTSRWNGRFRVIELDDFSEVLLAMYADDFPERMKAAL